MNQANEPDEPGLPDSYGEDRIELMPRGPGSLFLQWELEGEKSRAARAALGDEAFRKRRWVVRLFGEAPGGAMEIAVDPRARKLYCDAGDGEVRGAAIGVAGEGDAFDSYAECVISGESFSARDPGRERPDTARAAGGAGRSGHPASEAWSPPTSSGRVPTGEEE